MSVKTRLVRLERQAGKHSTLDAAIDRQFDLLADRVRRDNLDLSDLGAGDDLIGRVILAEVRDRV